MRAGVSPERRRTLLPAGLLSSWAVLADGAACTQLRQLPRVEQEVRLFLESLPTEAFL